MLSETTCTLVSPSNQELSSSTNTFSCDVDGKTLEIVIPEDAWDSENETVWLTQVQLAELYNTSVQNVGQHIGNIIEDEELQECSVLKESFITASDGKSYRTKLYSERAGKRVPRYAYHKDVCAELKQRIIDNPKYLKRFK